MEALSIIFSFAGAVFKLLIDSNKDLKEKVIILFLAGERVHYTLSKYKRSSINFIRENTLPILPISR